VLNGKTIRESANTRSWERAELKLRTMEQIAVPQAREPAAKVTIEEAVAAFLGRRTLPTFGFVLRVAVGPYDLLLQLNRKRMFRGGSRCPAQPRFAGKADWGVGNPNTRLMRVHRKLLNSLDGIRIAFKKMATGFSRGREVVRPWLERAGHSG
jgi:hypothetical protein